MARLGEERALRSRAMRLFVPLCRRLGVGILIAAVWPAAAGAQDLTEVVRARDVPVLRLSVRAAPTDAEIARIKGHIAGLANIDRPDMGLSSTYGGSSFAPLSQTLNAGVVILGAPRPETSGDVVELVKLGPKALPFLLEALDDATPTKLVLGHSLGAGAMGFGGVFRSNEISGNPANTAEFAIVGVGGPGYLRGERGFNHPVKDGLHAVTVGDVCFVIIGQITGRPSYRVARYQPSAITIINSPTDDPELVKQVRAVWAGGDPSQRLLDSLLLDFSTTVELPQDATRELRGQAQTAWFLPTGAAMRLLYYFPDEAGGLVARRLAQARDAGGERFWGMNYPELLKAVAWSEQPAVRAEVTNVLRETDDPKVFLLCLPAAERERDNDLVVERMLALLDALPPEPDELAEGPYGDGYRLVRAAGERLGAAAKPVYLRFMEQPSLRRRIAMCSAVHVRPEWAVELLAPLLDDTREERQWYAVEEGKDSLRLAIRVCDDAARTISLSRPDLPFVLRGTHAELDRQIAVMKERISREGGTTSVSSEE